MNNNRIEQMLPETFRDRMKIMLGDEYDAFAACYQKQKKQGLRVNTAKISVEDFLKITPFALTPIPWVKNGFFYDEAEPVTKHPHYFCGLYYIQEPSAMVPASRLPVDDGDHILDLCAAPGGKATELGARLNGSGWLYANDISASRASGLLKNLELFGIGNICVTAETPQKLAASFPESFQKILVDAPCSGEGMFRKDPSLIKSWENRGPSEYAPLQKEILQSAVQMLAPGGFLLYSTCTFADTENEQVIAWLLDICPELSLVNLNRYDGFSEGYRGCGLSDEDCTKCARIWPHKMDGEGHFTALLKKEATYHSVQQTDLFLPKGSLKKYRLSKDAEVFFSHIRSGINWSEMLYEHQGALYLLNDRALLANIRYLRTGLLVGTIYKDRFEPSQALAMYLKKEQYDQVCDLSSDDPYILKYLKGETLDCRDEWNIEKGWVLVCCDGYPLGWAKCVNGTMRNKYQPGWRMQ